MTFNIDLPDDQIATLAERALAAGLSTEQFACQVLQREIQAPKRRHISEVIRDNMRDAPPGVFDSLPADGASQVDHYIYGHAKR